MLELLILTIGVAPTLGIGFKIITLTFFGVLPGIDYFDGLSLVIIGFMLFYIWLIKLYNYCIK